MKTLRHFPHRGNVVLSVNENNYPAVENVLPVAETDFSCTETTVPGDEKV